MSDDSRGSYDISTMPVGVDRELERLRSQALITWPKEARNLVWMGLKPDMTILELGSGPGFVTEQLLDLVPQGEVIALEIDPLLVERAEQYLGATGRHGWRIVPGNIMHMDLPANSVDFAYARYLFQHLPDPVGAAREVFRVLKPGGKLAIYDVDDETNVFDPKGGPELQAIDARLNEARLSDQASKGGNRLVGRWLPKILKRAGYEKVDLEGMVLHNHVHDLNTLVPKPTRENMRPLVEAGLINEQELELILEEEARVPAEDRAILLPAFMAVGAKPLTA